MLQELAEEYYRTRDKDLKYKILEVGEDMLRIRCLYAYNKYQKSFIAYKLELGDLIGECKEILLRRGIDKYDPSFGLKFSNYLVTVVNGIAGNMVRNLRTQKRNSFSDCSLDSIIYDNEGTDKTLHDFTSEGTLEDCLYEKFDIQELSKAINRLTDIEKQVIKGLFIYEKTQTQVSKEIGCNQVYVSRTCTKALKKLREDLDLKRFILAS